MKFIMAGINILTPIYLIVILLTAVHSLSMKSSQNLSKQVRVKNELKYEPNWDSLDGRPLPLWYDQSKIGIFVHWGVYSVPSFGSEWFWWTWKGSQIPRYVEFMDNNYPPGFSYQDFAHEFKAEFFNATQWAELFAKAGAKYVVVTSKHHEGYTMWPSKYSFSWNSMDVGPHKDLVGEIADAIRSNTDLKFGLYHSLYEWFNPLYIADGNNSLATQDFVNFKTLPELYEIVNTYLPEIVWSDGEWERPDTYWKSTEFLAWLYNESPVKETVLTNDRWGHETLCKHGGYYTCQDRFNPGVLQPHKWENCYTLDKESWGYRRDAKIEDYLTPEELIRTMVETVSCGGNYLINVGPTKEGTIPIIQQERLLQLGDWLSVNGEAIYETVPWDVQNDTLTSGVWYTTRPSEKKVYAISVQWPGDELNLASVDASTVKSISILGSEEEIQWNELAPVGISINMPPMSLSKSRWSWAVVINII